MAVMGRRPTPIDAELLRLLAQEFSDEEIGSKLGLARVTITGARRRHNILSFYEYSGQKRRGGSAYHGGRARTLHFNERFFQKIDSEAAAYYLGLMIADGSICSGAPRLELSISEPDEKIVYDFADAIGYDKERIAIRTRADRKKKHYRLTVCSKAMKQDLEALGFTPNKSQDFILQGKIPRGLRGHLLRGFWDGDGSVSKNHFETGILSPGWTWQVVELMEEMMEATPSVRVSTTSQGKPFYRIDLRSTRHKPVRDAMYRTASIGIARKQKNYNLFWE